MKDYLCRLKYKRRTALHANFRIRLPHRNEIESQYNIKHSKDTLKSLYLNITLSPNGVALPWTSSQREGNSNRKSDLTYRFQSPICDKSNWKNLLSKYHTTDSPNTTSSQWSLPRDFDLFWLLRLNMLPRPVVFSARSSRGLRRISARALLGITPLVNSWFKLSSRVTFHSPTQERDTS